MKGILFFIVGLIVTMGGVGGVETSQTNYELFLSSVVSLVGLALMYVGVMYVNDQTNTTMRKLRSLP
jgi:uncharacterized membrane protein